MPAQQTQANIHALVANTLGGAASALGGGPVASALVSGLVNLLWPSPQQDVWDSIKQDVQNLVNQSLSADALSRLQTVYRGLENVMGPYTNGVAADTASNYMLARGFFLDQLPWFQQDGYETLLLPLYVQAVNLNLGLLRDGITFGSQWGKDPLVDPVEAQSDLTSLLYGTQGRQGAIDYVNQWFAAGRPANTPDPRCNGATSHAPSTTYTTHMTLTVLDFAAWWPYFDPSQHNAGSPGPRLNREIFSDSYWSDAPGNPGYTSGSGIPEWGKNETVLSHVTGWGDTRPTGVASGYADGLKPMEGHDNGTGATTSADIQSSDPVVSAQFTTQVCTNDFTLPTFDKRVVLTTRSGATITLGVDDGPLHLNWENVNIDIDDTDLPNYFFDEHVVSSVHMNPWAGTSIRANSNYSSEAPGSAIAVCNVVIGFRRWDSYADQQAFWRWCSHCQGLFLSLPGAASVCRKGGPHITTGSGQYVLFVNGAPPESVFGWTWCGKCGGLAKENSGNLCAAGGGHSTVGSGIYAMLLPAVQGSGPLPRIANTQDGWSGCSKCGLAFYEMESGSWCPADRGAHAASGPGLVIKYT